MLKPYHFGIFIIAVLISVNIIQAQMNQHCKFHNKTMEGTYCNRNCLTYASSDYRCDGGLTCCTCNHLSLGTYRDDVRKSHKEANCSTNYTGEPVTENVKPYKLFDMNDLWERLSEIINNNLGVLH